MVVNDTESLMTTPKVTPHKKKVVDKEPEEMIMDIWEDDIPDEEVIKPKEKVVKEKEKVVFMSKEKVKENYKVNKSNDK